MTNDERQKIERTIVEKIIDEALSRGYAILINNGGDENEITRSFCKESILENMFATDDEKMYFHVGSGDLKMAEEKPFGWVFLVYGNDGYDVINDYIVNDSMGEILNPVEKFISEQEETANG